MTDDYDKEIWDDATKKAGYDPKIKETIKDAIDLESLIGDTCPSNGRGRWAHSNKHPGSKSNDHVGLYTNKSGETVWKCFSCDVGGDCFAWIADRENLDNEADFPEILRIAAEYAGIKLPTTQEDDAKTRVFECIRVASRAYNDNLTDEMYAKLESGWGITRETCDEELIGYCKLDGSEKEILRKAGFTFDEVLSTGLIKTNKTATSFFAGRYTFPYRVRGRIEYMIGRKTTCTPDKRIKDKTTGKWEAVPPSKFEKLQTNNGNDYTSHISEHIKNIIYGTDSLRHTEHNYCIITEGIADAIAVIQAGFACASPVTIKFTHEDRNKIIKLVRRFERVYVCMDNEENKEGEKGALETARHLFNNGVNAYVVTLPRPDGIDKVDLADYLKEHSPDDLKRLLSIAVSASAISALYDPVDEDASQTDTLIQLGKVNTTFFHTPDDVCYVAATIDGGKTTILPMSTKGVFSKILRQRYYNKVGKAPNGESLKNAINTLEAMVWGDGNIIELYNRVAMKGDNICYDLTNGDYEAIEITSQGWGLLPSDHIIFRRFVHQLPQVMPVSGGDAWKALDFLNVSEKDRLLTMVYIISCFIPGIAHPIPIITGEHGAAKSTVSNVFKLLIDPSSLESVPLPGKEDEFYLTLSQSWLVLFDNVDWIKSWQSDSLCRASTGQASSSRKLYTDDDVVIHKYKMCVGINGISNSAIRPDLLDRAIFMGLDYIPRLNRKPEIDFWKEFHAARPKIMGGIFDVISKAISARDTIKLKGLPRMADFALWGCAISEALGRTSDEFMVVYDANISAGDYTALEASPIGTAVMSLMSDIDNWTGTPSELLVELSRVAVADGVDTMSKSWAQTSFSLGKRIKKIIPNLRKIGIKVERDRNMDGVIYRITK
jgi:hypothetical protein